MNKRIRNKKEKQANNFVGLSFCYEKFGKRVGEIGFIEKELMPRSHPDFGADISEFKPMTEYEIIEVGKLLKIEFDKSGKDSASYITECGRRFEFKKDKNEK